MARSLTQILQELNSVYKPQKDLYNTQLGTLDPQMQAEEKGLEAAKQSSFGEINQGANRRGMIFSGIPLAEQAQYTGQSFLPALANLKGKYAQQRFNLQDALAKIIQEQQRDAYSIYDSEIARDEAAAARAAASRGGGGFNFGGGGGGGGQVQGAQITLRQQWQNEAKAGDWNAQVALNYAGDDGRYDGPVNSQDEYNRLKDMGVTGNYYVRTSDSGGGGEDRTGMKFDPKSGKWYKSPDLGFAKWF